VIPKIDLDLGLSAYSTSFKGVKGKIKETNQDFAVSEVLHDKILSKISKDDNLAIYKLRKDGIDTRYALNDIQRRFGLVLIAFGLKDAKAITEQYVQAKTTSRSLENIDGRNYSLKRLGFVKKPISKQNILGNKFKIKISNLSDSISNFSEYDKFLNYFGYQRFGSKRPITHLIGKAIIQNEYSKTIDLLLNFLSPYDTDQNNNYRKIISETKTPHEVIDLIPKSMDIEILVLKKLSESNDAKLAIRAIPLQMRRFYIQSYQSYIFNKTLSLAFEYDEDLFTPQESDVCFDSSNSLGKFQNDPNQKLAIPLVGHSYFKKTRFDYYIEKILEEEELTPSSFLIKDFQEISVEGGFRNAIINCNDFQVTNNTVEFMLSRGSYATIILREILKPEDPLGTGF